MFSDNAEWFDYAGYRNPDRRGIRGSAFHDHGAVDPNAAGSRVGFRDRNDLELRLCCRE